MDVGTYQEFELDQNFVEAHGNAAVNDRRNSEILSALSTPGDVGYQPCAEALSDAPSPAGQIEYIADWRSTNAFPETTRHLWIAVPSELKPGDSPGLAVFNDGGGYLNPEGAVRAQRVLDRMRSTAELPPIVGVFLSPGRPFDVPPSASALDMNTDPRATLQRSVEYDSLTPRYGSMLVDEVLPFVEQKIGVQIDQDPAKRAIVGISSGGICAWTAAWHRPDQFGLVLSHCGSFVNIRGGHSWPYLIRSNQRRPIRAFLQSGAADANIIYGNWPLANQQMAVALEFAGYDARFEFGTGGHNLQHGGQLFADSLRWLFGPS